MDLTRRWPRGPLGGKLRAFRDAGKPEGRIGSPTAPHASAPGEQIQSGREFGERKRKRMKENKRNYAFISFQESFGNGTFQWVTADSNRKTSLLDSSRHRLREAPF
jgi:hypothetical protein